MAVDHNIWWWVGRDRRAPSRIPIFKKGSWAMVGSNPLNQEDSPGSGWSGPVAIPRCSDPANPPIGADSIGQSFPANTVFVPAALDISGWAPGWGFRIPPNDANPLIDPSVSFAGVVDMVYIAIGIPPGATLQVLTIVGNISHTTYYSLPAPVTMTGATFYLEVPTFTVPASDTTCTVTSQWSVPPAAEGIGSAPGDAADFAGGYVVPTTLPAGYTARMDTDLSRGAAFASCGGDVYRLRAGPNSTYESMGIGVGPIASGGKLLWIGGIPYNYHYMPIARGDAVISATATFVAFVGPTGSGTIGPTPGCRYMQVSFVYTKLASDPAAGDSFSYQVTQDGSPVASGSAMGSAIKSIATVTVPISLPALGSTTTFVITVNGSGAGPPPAWTVTATLSGSPRCDIPMPYTVSGPGTVIPGGYYPPGLSTPVNNQPLSDCALGVTSVGLGRSPGNARFRPVVDGWYQVLISGTAQPYIGEDPFGWQDLQTARRGHANHPFYARADAGGTLVLTPYVPPSPTVCASSGTTITQDAASWGAFASVALPAAGTWKIKIAVGFPGSATAAGLIVDLSLTDPQLVNATSSQTWEPRGTTAFNTSGAFSGVMTNTPQVYSATNIFYQWIVGANPTGAWAGHTNAVATWDVLNAGWVFDIPVAGSIMFDQVKSITWWFDGNQWHSNGTDPQITMAIATTGPQTVFLLVSPYSSQAGAPRTVRISWSAA